MNVLDANVVIGFLDRENALHERAVRLLKAHEGESFSMHPVTVAEVLAGPAQLDRANAASVWASILQMGIVDAVPDATPLDVAVMRASTGLPIPDCLVILSSGDPAYKNPIITFDERLAAKASELGYVVVQ